jgi:hypothetical protein
MTLGRMFTILYQRKQAKMHWLQDPNEFNVDNLNNVRCEATRHLRYKKRKYLKARIDELETNNKNKNIRDLHKGTSDFKKCYQPRTNRAKDERDDLIRETPTVFWLGARTTSLSY